MDMVLCVAVGHVSALGTVMLQHGKACRTYGARFAAPQYTQGFPHLGQASPPLGAGACKGELQRSAPKRRRYRKGDHWCCVGDAAGFALIEGSSLKRGSNRERLAGVEICLVAGSAAHRQIYWFRDRCRSAKHDHFSRSPQ